MLLNEKILFILKEQIKLFFYLKYSFEMQDLFIFGGVKNIFILYPLSFWYFLIALLLFRILDFF